MALSAKFLSMAQHFISLQLNNFDLGVEKKRMAVCGLLRHGFAWKQRVLKMFPGLAYLRSEEGVF